ncbi:hypothetical protein [Brucella endophytica]|uniref:hypothetical protein n=1 Tax=Brucella endophytica TaxID=1963359 RepID=UPI001666CBFF|nr:hypothetical protein [Brucella endophytica]
MGFIFALILIPAAVAMIFSPFIAYGFYRDGDIRSAAKASAVFIVCALIVVATPRGQKSSGHYDDCERYSSFAESC